MKTKIELLGFEVEIEEVDGKLDVKVRAGEEVVEELSLDPSEYDLTVDEEEFEGEELATEDDDIKSFDEFEGEDVDVDSEDELIEDELIEDEEEEEEDDDCDDCDDDDVSESLRSFDNFFKKKKK